MTRSKSIHRPLFLSLTLAGVACTWWGCSASPEDPTTGGGGPTGSTSGGTGGSTSGSTGGVGIDTGGGTTSSGDGGACVSTSAVAERVPLDIIFLVDRSGSMSGAKWTGTTTALKDFFNDPASTKIGAGMSFFPNYEASACNADDYKTLDVPIATLPANAFALSNAIPADAKGNGTPTYAALQGTLQAATAYQDAHPTHKVVVVLATDGDPYGCDITSIDLIAGLAQDARSYNGVLTYVIGVEGSTIANLNKIATAGGTNAAYDVTSDISQFAAKMEDIRGAALGCEFQIPPPPGGEELDPTKVNFSYTPQGVGMSKLLLQSSNLLTCGADPGWYYDSNSSPSKIILCPASCATVQADSKAEVSVLFGCKTQIK